MKNTIAALLAATAASMALLLTSAPAHADQLQPDPAACAPGNDDRTMSEAEWYVLDSSLGARKRDVVRVVGTWGDRFEEASSRYYLVREYHLCWQTGAGAGHPLTVGLMFTRTAEDMRWMLHEVG